MPYKNANTQRQYQAHWVKERRKRWFLANGPCECGSWDSLELHHRDPSTKVSHSIWSWSWKRIYEEVAKCKILCKACHRKETNQQLYPLRHGTIAGYRYCKCEQCKSAKMRYNRERLERIKKMKSVSPLSIWGIIFESHLRNSFTLWNNAPMNMGMRR